MFSELESVVLMEDLPDHGLAKGDIGTIVLVHGEEGYEVEFVTLTGETVGVVSLRPDQLPQAERHEISHARPLRRAS